MTKQVVIVLMSLLENKIMAIVVKMIAFFLPAKVVLKMVEFVVDMPLEKKNRVMAEIKNRQERMHRQYPRVFYQEDPHYTRTDEKQSPYEDYYMEHEIKEDRPHNQLYLYKRYTRQLEQKIKQLEEQLKGK